MSTPFGYVDPIYIVIVFLIVVGIFMVRLDRRFVHIEKSLRGVQDASENTSRNSDQLPVIAGNTGPMSRDEIIRSRDMFLASANEPIGQSDNPLADAGGLQHGQS